MLQYESLKASTEAKKSVSYWRLLSSPKLALMIHLATLTVVLLFCSRTAPSQSRRRLPEEEVKPKEILHEVLCHEAKKHGDGGWMAFKGCKMQKAPNCRDDHTLGSKLDKWFGWNTNEIQYKTVTLFRIKHKGLIKTSKYTNPFEISEVRFGRNNTRGDSFVVRLVRKGKEGPTDRYIKLGKYNKSHNKLRKLSNYKKGYWFLKFLLQKKRISKVKIANDPEGKIRKFFTQFTGKPGDWVQCKEIFTGFLSDESVKNVIINPNPEVPSWDRDVRGTNLTCSANSLPGASLESLIQKEVNSAPAKSDRRCPTCGGSGKIKMLLGSRKCNQCAHGPHLKGTEVKVFIPKRVWQRQQATRKYNEHPPGRIGREFTFDGWAFNSYSVVIGGEMVSIPAQFLVEKSRLHHVSNLL